MKKLLLILSLVLFGNPSFAEWKRVAFSAEADTYIDTERIKKRGDIVYYWILMDVMKTKKSNLFKSFRSYNKANCFDFVTYLYKLDILKLIWLKDHHFSLLGNKKNNTPFQIQ